MVRHAYNRSDRIAELIQRGVTQILLRQISDPRLKNLNVLKVKVSPDLKIAKIFVSAIQNEPEQVMEGLQKAKNYLRGELGHQLNLRFTPDLVFKWDDSVAYSIHIAEVIADLHKKEEPAGEEKNHESGEDS
ncbi:MAG: 30S ribosome-binding factor RbfA [Candidatus Schekmanbacteria bacterium]|nr:30S ribosome-binding factor RbfA [Candidatus Schekmanbacteria bacterium]